MFLMKYFRLYKLSLNFIRTCTIFKIYPASGHLTHDCFNRLLLYKAKMTKTACWLLILDHLVGDLDLEYLFELNTFRGDVIYYLTDKWLQLYHIFVCCLHVVCFLHYICNGPQFVMAITVRCCMCLHTKNCFITFCKISEIFFHASLFYASAQK